MAGGRTPPLQVSISSMKFGLLEWVNVGFYFPNQNALNLFNGGREDPAPTSFDIGYEIWIMKLGEYEIFRPITYRNGNKMNSIITP